MNNTFNIVQMYVRRAGKKRGLVFDMYVNTMLLVFWCEVEGSRECLTEAKRRN